MPDEERDSKDIYDSMIPNLSRMLNDDDDTVHPLGDEVMAIDERYDARNELGRGGMKRIIEAHDKLTSRKVAQALLLNPENPDMVERFIKEARLTAALEHPNIVPLHDLGFDADGQPYFTMKLVGGDSLGDLIRDLEASRRSLPLQALMEIFVKVCDAAAYAHSKGIVHLDLKPENIRLGEYGEVLVCDWGLAKVIGEADETSESPDPGVYNEVTLHGMVKGSPGYMAPEQISSAFGPKTERTDIYSLGALLYALLCRRPPVQGDSVEEILKKTEQGNILLPTQIGRSIPTSLEAVAMKALSLRQENRYESVTQLRDDITKWMRGFATSAEDQHFLKSCYLLFRRHRAIASMLLLLISATVGFAVVISIKERQAVEALRLYRQEQRERVAAGIEASPRLCGLAMQALKANDCDTALDMIDLAVLRDPTNTHAWESKARIHFVRMEFDKARAALTKVTRESEHQGVLELQEFLKTPLARKKVLTAADIRHLMQREHAKYDIAFLFLHNARRYAIADRIDLCRTVLEIQNYNVRPVRFQANVHGKDVHVDLANNKNLERIDCLEVLPVTHLDISGTRVRDTSALTRFPLVELNIQKTKIDDLAPIIAIPTLRKLIIGRRWRLDDLAIPEHLTIEQK